MKTIHDEGNERIHILIAEDSKVQASLLERLLEGAGYEVTVASNGREAMDKVRQQPFNIIITDILMPEVDGFEFCTAVKADDALKKIPVIILTSLSNPNDIIRGLQSGADNFITKPYNDKYLLTRVRHLLVNSELRRRGIGEITLEIIFNGKKYAINSERQQMLDLLLSVFETAMAKNEDLTRTQDELEVINEQLTERNNELIKAQEELKRLSEEKFRSIFETAPSLLIVLNRDGIIKDCNGRVDQYLGYGKDELVGLHVSAIIHPDHVEKAAEFFRDIAALGFSYNQECRMTRKDGSIIDVSVNSALLTSAIENEIDTVCIIEDITKRKQAETALRESEEKHRILLDESSDPIFSFEPDGRYRYVNRAFAEGVGMKIEEIISRTIWDVFSREEADMRFAALSQVINTGKEKIIEARVPREDGDRYYLTTITPIKSVEGRVESAICSSKDITGLKNITKLLNEQIEELNRWQDALLGRETRIIELKREVNELLEREGMPARYASVNEESLEKNGIFEDRGES